MMLPKLAWLLQPILHHHYSQPFLPCNRFILNMGEYYYVTLQSPHFQSVVCACTTHRLLLVIVWPVQMYDLWSEPQIIYKVWAMCYTAFVPNDSVRWSAWQREECGKGDRRLEFLGTRSLYVFNYFYDYVITDDFNTFFNPCFYL